jgi:hypothetical protein
MKDKNKIFRLSATEESMLKKIAKAYGTDESKAIRRLIREGYNNLKGENKDDILLQRE